MTLKSYGILNDCQYKQPIPAWIQGKFHKYLVEKNKEKMCYFLIYSPVLKYTWEDMRKKIFASRTLYFRALYQILEQLNIMRLSGFRQAFCEVVRVIG